MKVLLLTHVPNLGQMGEVKIVRDGFAMNFLLPQKKAQQVPENFVPAKGGSTATVTNKKSLLPAGASITISAKATDHQNLYAGISAAEIVKQLKLQLGIAIEAKQLIDFKPLKHLGIFQISVRTADGESMVKIHIKPLANAS